MNWRICKVRANQSSMVNHNLNCYLFLTLHSIGVAIQFLMAWLLVNNIGCFLIPPLYEYDKMLDNGRIWSVECRPLHPSKGVLIQQAKFIWIPHITDVRNGLGMSTLMDLTLIPSISKFQLQNQQIKNNWSSDGTMITYVGKNYCYGEQIHQNAMVFLFYIYILWFIWLFI